MIPFLLYYFIYLRNALHYMLTELCAISVCEHLLYRFKIILTKTDLPEKSRFFLAFFKVFLTRVICGIIVKSELMMNFSFKMSVTIATVHKHSADLKIVPKLLTRNCHLSKYFFNPVELYLLRFCVVSKYGFARNISS